MAPSLFFLDSLKKNVKTINETNETKDMKGRYDIGKDFNRGGENDQYDNSADDKYKLHNSFMKIPCK